MIVEELKINTAETTKTVKDLRAQLKGLKDELLNCEQGTEEYNKTLQQAANIQKELKDQMMEVNNSAQDFGQVVGNVSGVMAGFSGAVTAATGALSLFGVENEEMQKQITATMTSLIGITEGLSKIDNGVKAFKRLTIAIKASTIATNGFAKALIATGLGAIVVVIGSIVAYWDEFTAALGLSSEQMERFGDIARGVLNSISSAVKGIATSFAKLFKGDFKGAVNELKNGFNVVKNFQEGVAQSEAKREEERTKKAKEEADKRAKIAEQEYQKRIKAAEQLAKYEKDMDAAKYRGTGDDKYTQEAYNRQMKYYNTLFAVYRKDSIEYKNLILEKEQYLQDWENHFLKVAENEQRTAEETVRKERESNLALLSSWWNDQASEQQRLDKRYQMLINAAIKEGEDVNAISEWYAEETIKIAAKAQEAQTRKEEEEAEKRILIKKKEIQAGQAMADATGDILLAISDMLEEGTAEQKALATAGTTIQMLAGIASALAMTYTTHTGWWDWAIGISQAASIAASGIASIVKINQVKSDGSNSGQASLPSINMGSVVTASPDFSQTFDGAVTSAAIKDQKVYVTEHDITDTQKKVEVAQNEATY